jgi:hypothetical protein|tara:strand:+ start:14718 stop:15401 length:684 start_codon:yes stop_codon:yes gene_type:complete
MKKRILLVTMLLLVSTVEANYGERSNLRKDYTSVYDAEPIQFKERGIKFYVFLNGEFDFNTQPNRNNNVSYLNKKSRRSSKILKNKGIKIEHDYKGRVRRIGNVFVNYNRYGKVTRIGKVFVKYNRRYVSKVGGLKVLYNNWGNLKYIGKVKIPSHSFFWNFRNTLEYDYDDDFFFKGNFINDFESYDEDEDYLYYRSKDVKKGNKGSVIKRKKRSSSSRKRRRIIK